MKWVKLNKYCELSGDTVKAVYTRRSRGVWIEGVHSRLAPDGKLWVNLEEIAKWVETGVRAA